MATSPAKKKSPSKAKPAVKAKPTSKAKPAVKKTSTSEAKPELKGKPFERLVAAVRAKLAPTTTSIEWDVRIRAKSTVLRQFDVVVRGPAGSDFALAVVEVKDRGRPVHVDMVGAFNSALRSINATKGIMVSNRGFTQGALLEARQQDIDTFVLRPASDADWKGYLRSVEMELQSLVLRHDDAEIEFANGDKRWVPRPHSCILLTPSGNTFFDRTMSGWLNEHDWEEGQLVEVPIQPGVTASDEDPTEVSWLRSRPRYQEGVLHKFTLVRREDWVFVKYLPGQVVDPDEKHFFEFKELDSIAEEVKKAKEAQVALKKQKPKKNTRLPKSRGAPRA